IGPVGVIHVVDRHAVGTGGGRRSRRNGNDSQPEAAGKDQTARSGHPLLRSPDAPPRNDAPAPGVIYHQISARQGGEASERAAIANSCDRCLESRRRAGMSETERERKLFTIE